MNWKAKPLLNVQLVIDLIAATTTAKGLKVKSKLDSNLYEKGEKISNKELANLNITKNIFHGEWNYKISPVIV